jgi:hypothetical protein
MGEAIMTTPRLAAGLVFALGGVEDPFGLADDPGGAHFLNSWWAECVDLVSCGSADQLPLQPR